MKRVVMVTHYFPPSSASGAFRMLGFAKYLPACGWDVTVIAPRTAPFEPVDMSLCQRVPESVRQVRFPYQPSRFSLRLGALLGRLQVVDRHCIALPAFVNAMIACVRREQPDVILTSGPPHSTHIAGWVARRLFGIPWVMDLRDPWLLGRSIRTEWVRRCYGAANAVISNTQTAKHATVERYPECGPKSVVITNGYDPDLFTGSTPSSDGRIVFSYVGNFYGRRTPEPLLRAVANVLQRRPELRSLLQVNFAGRWDGRTAPEQGRLFQELGLTESVRLLGQIDHTAAVGLMRKSDVLILVQAGPFSMSIPAKTYEYLAARRTILCLAPPGGELVTRLQRTGARVHVASSGSAAEIQNALLTVVSQLETESADAQEHRVAIKEYSQPHLAKQLAGLLFQVIERNHVVQKNEGRPAAGQAASSEKVSAVVESSRIRTDSYGRSNMRDKILNFVRRPHIPWFVRMRFPRSARLLKFGKVNPNTRAYWDRKWGQGTYTEQTYEELRQAVLQAVPLGSTVLDAGCGSGTLMEMLRDERSCKCVGVDISAQSVAITRAKGFPCYRTELPALPAIVKQMAFDVCTITETLEHLSSPGDTVMSLREVLRPGGLIAATTPDMSDPEAWGEDWEHINRFTAESLTALFEPVFCVETCRAVGAFLLLVARNDTAR